MYDIVTLLGPCDIDHFKKNIKTTLSSLKNYKNVYIISYDPTISIDNCITVDEAVFPFKFADVEQVTGKFRAGWYLQQLIKLYSCFVLKLDNFLIIDADTVILKDIDFFKDYKLNFNTSTEYHLPYFVHIKYLIPDLDKQAVPSGICHLMPMKRHLVESLFEKIESQHSDYLWKVMLRYVDPKHYRGSGMSEYELFFNFCLKFHSNEIVIRNLNWKNISNMGQATPDLSYVSVHWYMR